jgi:hypothetical protein
MWPWEHLALGYLAYSLWSRQVARRPPTPREAAVVALGTQFPDLVDKPLGWVFHLLPSGVSLAHSALVAIPTALSLFALATLDERARLGLPFAVGYLSHLPADAGFGLLLGGSSKTSFLLWPLVPQESVIGSTGVLQFVTTLFTSYLTHLGGPSGVGYLLFEVGLIGSALVVWQRDGRPLLARSRGSAPDPRTE